MPLREYITATPVLGDEFKDMKIGQGRARRAAHFFDESDAALRINERALFFTPTGSRKIKMAQLGRLRAGIHVLHDQKIEFWERLIEGALVDPGMRAVSGNDPEPANFAF